MRSFIISDAPSGKTRAGHAVSYDEVLVVLQGSCLLTVRLPEGKRQHPLSPTTGAAFVPGGTWMLLSNFKPDTIVLAYALEKYRNTRYF